MWLKRLPDPFPVHAGDLANLLTGPIPPVVLTPEYVNFFETFIANDVPVKSRASAAIAPRCAQR